MKIQNLDSYKGVRDFYPEDMNNLNKIISTWKNSLQKFGFQEYTASILESTELYESKSSDEIVSEQTYNFIDRGERRVTLRPEMTPTLARMIAKKYKELTFPIRWFSVPNVFRYEQPQKGRLREHWQLNVDLLGINSIEAEVEVLNIAYQIMTDFGLTESDFVIKINDREILNQLARELDLDESKRKDFFRLLDKKDKIENFNEEVYKLIGKNLNFSIEPNKNIKDIIQKLSEIGITNLVYDPYLVRGFDYYTGTVFEIFDTNPSNRRAIFGGGRYDKLVEDFGAPKIEAVGFGMGDVTLLDVLNERGLLKQKSNQADLYICVIDKEYYEFSLKTAQKLRSENIRVIVDYSYKKISNQIEKALKKNIPYLICIGEDEVKSNKFKLKNLSQNSEKKMKIEKIIKLVKKDLLR